MSIVPLKALLPELPEYDFVLLTGCKVPLKIICNWKTNMQIKCILLRHFMGSYKMFFCSGKHNGMVHRKPSLTAVWDIVTKFMFIPQFFMSIKLSKHIPRVYWVYTFIAKQKLLRNQIYIYFTSGCMMLSFICVSKFSKIK